MDVRSTNTLVEGLFAPRSAPSSRALSTPPLTSPPSQNGPLDSVDVQASSPFTAPRAPRLINELREETENGFRITQDFEGRDGRRFTRTQALESFEGGIRREIIQQNASGSTIRREEILEAQDNGLFRRTQRFTDETGRTQASIQTDFVITDPGTASSAQFAPEIARSGYAPNYNAAPTPRGERFDIQI